MPLISIIVPIYNAQDFLDECITSILKQDFSDFELLLVNDGSTDNSKQIAESYVLEDNRVKLFHKKNGGQSSARNLALNEVSGQYILFVDADDVIVNNALSILYQNMVKYDTDIIAYQFHKIDVNSTIIGTAPLFYDSYKVYSPGEFLTKFTVLGAMCMYFYKTSYIKSIGIKLIEGIILEDEDFVIRAIANSVSIVSIEDRIYLYRDNPSSTTQLMNPEKVVKKIDSLIIVITSLKSAVDSSIDNAVKLGIMKKIESLLISFFMLLMKNRKSLSVKYKVDKVSELRLLGLFPLVIRVNGLVYRVFAGCVNLVFRMYGR